MYGIRLISLLGDEISLVGGGIVLCICKRLLLSMRDQDVIWRNVSKYCSIKVHEGVVSRLETTTLMVVTISWC